MGTAGGLLVVFLLCRAACTSRSPWRRSVACFWLAFTASAFVLGVAVVGRSEDTGLAQICLAPLVLFGLTYLATQLGRLPSAARAFLGFGLAIVFAIGIALHFNLENLNFDTTVPSVSPLAAAVRGGPVSLAAFANWTVKRAFHLVFLGDHIGGWAPVLQLLLAAGAVALILRLIRVAPRRRVGGDPGRPAVALPPTRVTRGSAVDRPTD